jgi:hypothetical protein
MFVVDPGGVLVTDPMNAEAGRVYLQYEAFLPMNVDRMCLYWRNGWQ